MEEKPAVQKDTLELMYEEVKERLKSQLDSVNDLENKASSIIRFVGILTGLGIAWIQILTKSEAFQFSFRQGIVILSTYILGMTSFLISIICAFAGYKVSRFRADPNPKRLLEKYFYYPREKLLEQLLDNFAISHVENSKIMKRKSVFVSYSFVFFIIGLLFIFISMITYMILKFDTFLLKS